MHADFGMHLRNEVSFLFGGDNLPLIKNDKDSDFVSPALLLQHHIDPVIILEQMGNPVSGWRCKIPNRSWKECRFHIPVP